MKKINFIHSVSSQQQQAIARWYRISKIFTCIVIITIIVLQSKQLIDLMRIKNKQTILIEKVKKREPLMQKQQQLQIYKQQLQQQNDHLNTIASSNNNPAHHIKQLLDALGSSTTIITFSRKQNILNLSLLVINARILKSVIKNIKALPFIDTVNVHALQQKESNIHVILQSILNK